MNLTVIGTGYVGLVTGACFAEMGNNVTCVDTNRSRIDELRQGVIPIHEPGLDAIVQRNAAEGRMRFEYQLSDATTDVDVFFIAVGTPSNEDGSADLHETSAGTFRVTPSWSANRPSPSARATASSKPSPPNSPSAIRTSPCST
jgi:UDPglucose 6-dehydrogenase